MTPTTLACPQCGGQNAFESAACSACGASLSTLAGNATTLEVAPLEQDPQTAELWEQLRNATIGEYDIYAPIGRGGMATVFLALDLALERDVAIKVISPDMLQTKSVVERFKREARTAASLSHPNIIPVYQVKDVNGLVMFVMKYVDGRSLDSVIREQRFVGFDLVMSVLTQVGSALHFAHRKGVVHRDVKPANVMIDQDGWVVVTDFGIAKVEDSGSLTSAGMIVGTPAYMSPEQFSNVAVTGSADQYSLGVVGYEMLTGKTPFSATSVAEMMRAHLIHDAQPARQLRPDIPAPLSDMIMRMLEKDPANRWPNIGAALAALEPMSRAREDDARAVLISLAKSGSQARPRISVPVSPLLSRPGVATASVIAPTAVKNRWRRGALYAGVGAVAIAATLFALKPFGRLSTTTQTPAAGNVKAAEPIAGNQPLEVVGPPAPKTLVDSGARASAAKANVPDNGVKKKPVVEARKPAPDSSAARRAQTPTDSQRAGLIASPPVVPPVTSAVPVDTQGAKRPSPDPVANGFIRIGSRIPNAVLYLDGKAQGFLNSLRYLELKPGTVRIGVHADGCTSWDSTITVRPGDTLRVNYRNPTCPP